MKIYAILDHAGYNKTMLNVVEKWKEQGHEVQVDMYYDVAKADWADVVFGEYIQGGVIGAVSDPNLKTPIYIRGIDIDLYFGHYMGIDWNVCKAVLFINDYMKEWTVDKYRASKGDVIKVPVEVVPLGIDVDKWTFDDKSATHGKTIGWINNFWSGKGIALLCQVIHKLVPLGYKFEVVGHSSEHWLIKYFNEYVERNGLSEGVKRIGRVENVNDWFKGIDFIMSTSMKECMSLPLAEGMAKGIKPVIHNWWGADKIYGKEYVWNSIEEILPILEGEYNSDKYRQFIVDNYSLEKEVNKLNEIMGIK